MSVFVYNAESINYYVEEDNGSITSPAIITDDFGTDISPQTLIQIQYGVQTTTEPQFSSTNVSFDNNTVTNDNHIEIQTEDYGNNFVITDTLIPMGTFLSGGSLSGEAVTSHYTAPHAPLPLAGNALSSLVRTWVGNGSLFEIGSGLERTVADYLGSGTLRLDKVVSETALESFTFDSSESTDRALFNFTDSASTAEIQVYTNVASGSPLLISETALESFAFGYNESPNGSLFEIGSGLEKSVASYTGSGTILVSETLLESFTFDYNESSIVQLDYGFITSTNITEFNDYDSVDGIVPGNYPGDDFGLITSPSGGSGILQPLVGGFELSGSSGVELTLIPPGDVVLFTFAGEAEDESVTFSEVGIGTAYFSGAYSDLSATFKEIGTGELYKFSALYERRTFDYVGSGTLTASGTTSSEKFIAQTPEDTILLTFTNTPLVHPDVRLIPSITGIGTIFVSGELNHPDIDFTPSYTGGGTLFGFDSAFESIVVEPPSDNLLFEFVGIVTAGKRVVYNPPEDLPTFNISGVSSNREIQVYPYNVTPVEIVISGELNHPDIDFTPHYGIEKNIGIGTTGIQFSEISAATERVIFEPPSDTLLFEFVGIVTADKKVVYNPPEDLPTINISGGISSEIHVNVAVENTLLFSASGTARERTVAQGDENTILLPISGAGDTKVEFNYGYYGDDVDPGTSGIITLSGTPLVHPEIRVIPHYGIERNIGVGTTGIQFGVGVGTFPDGDGNPRDAKTYSNRYGFEIGDFNLGSGIGTFRFNQTDDLAQYSPLTPYFGSGLFDVLGSADEAYARTTYIASGNLTILGESENAPVQVYGYYGDDRDPGTSGVITISQQTGLTIVVNAYAYPGTGLFAVSGTAEPIIRSFVYDGSGSIDTLSGSSESRTIDTSDDGLAILYTIVGTAEESEVESIAGEPVLYAIDGTLQERTSNAVEGVGSVSISGISNVIYVPKYDGVGTFRFVSYLSDNTYDTCDNDSITTDYGSSAEIAFIANPPESFVLYDIIGSADTANTSLSVFLGVGIGTISGSVSDIKLTKSELGQGSILTISSVVESETNIYSGSGFISIISEGEESISAQTPESTVTLSIHGSSDTKIESEYTAVGIGLFNFTDSASTAQIQVYTNVASGLITIYGEVIEPDVLYVPAFTSRGTISILGSAEDSHTRIYQDSSGTLFKLSGGLESFAPATYIGLGTIYTISTESLIINNPFQIPRTYVVII